MSWLVFDYVTGAELRRSDDAPVLASGEQAQIVPASALMVPALTAWSAEARGFVDVPPPISRATFIALWTPAEAVAVYRSPDDHMVYFWTQVLAADTIHLGNSRVAAGVGHAVALSILTPARAAQILAGMAPA